MVNNFAIYINTLKTNVLQVVARRSMSKMDKINLIREQKNKEVREFDLVASLFNLQQTSEYNSDIVDNDVWNDLNMNCVFSKIDNCVTPIGSQYLYSTLRKYKQDEQLLIDKFSEFNYLKNNPQQNDALLSILLPLENKSIGYVTRLIFSSIPKKKNIYNLIFLLPVFLLASVGLGIFIDTKFFLLMGVIAVINLATRLIFSKSVFQYYSELGYLNEILKTASQLSKYADRINIQKLQELSRHKKLISSLRKKTGWVTLDKLLLNEMLGSMVEYLNVFFLFDCISFILSMDTLKKHQNDIIDIYNTVASTDVSASMAYFLLNNTEICNPKFTDLNFIKAENIRHPLVDDAVGNTIDINNKSILLTGSNMAGKTTFIKTLGVNAILSQALYFAFADEFSLPWIKVKTSIDRKCDIEKGESYYFKEVTDILNLINLPEHEKHLVLIDEIFRGTNTIERIASSAAVLKHIGDSSITLVTTHDIELQEHLNGVYDMYHFSEQVENNHYYFDYKIKMGACSSRNAIKLLDIKEYPKSIVKSAYLLADKLDNSKQTNY